MNILSNGMSNRYAVVDSCHHQRQKYFVLIRAVESEVPSSDSDSLQFRLSDSGSNSDSDSGLQLY